MTWKAAMAGRTPLAVGLLDCLLAFPGRDAVVHAGTPVSPADKGVPEKLDVDLTRFLIRVRSQRASRSVEAWDHRREIWHALKCVGDAVYEAPRSPALLGPRGEARLWIDPPPEGVYLLGGYARNALPPDSVNWLRTHSLAYVEGRFRPGEEIRLSHRSQRVEIQRAAGEVSRIALNGEALLAGPVEIRVRGELARFDEAAGVFRDAWDNPIDVQVRELGDRLRFDVAYTIEHSQDTWSDVRVVFRPAPTVDRFETLCWYGNEDRFSSSPVGEEITSVLCENPFVLVRSAEGPFLGFLDHDQSNLFFRATPKEASVEYWAWPREQGARYQWTFEVIPGYGSYANAFLRALDPHTTGFRREIRGHAGFRGATRRAEEAAAAGVRVVWYHGCWFHRNGKYFNPQQPLEAEYETAAGQLSTYAERIEDIRRAHEAGIKVCVYTQFTGISRPAVGDFESSMAIQGKRFWEAVRRTLDRHDAIWIANVPRSMTIFRLADGVIADIVHSPWNMFFLRAMAGEKNLFAFPRPDRVRGVPEEHVGVTQWTESSALLGSWIRADSIIKAGGGPICAVEIAPDHPRLLYIIPCGASYPRYWVFSKGGTKLQYSPKAGASVSSRYAGSEKVDDP